MLERPSPSDVSPLPMLACVVLLGIGCGLGWPGVGPAQGLVWVSVAAGAGLVALGLGLAGHAWGVVIRPWVMIAAVWVLGLSGWLLGLWAVERSGGLSEGEGVALAAVEGPEQSGRSGRYVRASLESVLQPDGSLAGHGAGIRLWLKLPQEVGPVLPGDRLLGHLAWWAPQRGQHPGARDSQNPLIVRDIQGLAAPKGPLQKVSPQARGIFGSIELLLLRKRQESLGFLRDHAGSSGVFEALIVGQGACVDEDVQRAFSMSGLAHVLSVSGLHFGLVAMMLMGVLRMFLRRWTWGLRRWGLKRITAAVLLPVMAGYLVFVGAPVSAQRSFVMVAVVLLGHLLRREGHALISLALAAIVLLFVSPGALLGIGFQLSFVAVLGLLWAGEGVDRPLQERVNAALGRKRPWLNRFCGWMVSMGVATAAASLATLPLVLWHFGQTPLVGLFANFWVVPVVSYVLLPLGLLGIVAWQVWEGFGEALLALAVWVESWLTQTVHGFIDIAPWINAAAPGLPGWLIWLIAGLCLVLLRAPIDRALRRWIAPLLVLMVLGGVFVALGAGAPEGFHGEPLVRVTFLPVGQGDSTLIEGPDGQRWLIDAGGAESWDPGAMVVVPSLYALGIRRLDHVVVTHPDLDHFGGVPAVVRAMKPRVVWVCGVDDPSARYADISQAAQEVGAEVKVLSSAHPEVLLGGGARLQVLWPHAPDPKRGKNDNSIVLRLEHGAVSWLLPGDLEAPGEDALVQSGALLQATVLKAGHHGSQTSSTQAFLDAVSPQVVLYSVGENNKFNLPHQAVVERFERLGALPFRTDTDGTIRMESDGAQVRIQIFDPMY